MTMAKHPLKFTKKSFLKGAGALAIISVCWSFAKKLGLKNDVQVAKMDLPIDVKKDPRAVSRETHLA